MMNCTILCPAKIHFVCGGLALVRHARMWLGTGKTDTLKDTLPRQKSRRTSIVNIYSEESARINFQIQIQNHSHLVGIAVVLRG